MNMIRACLVLCACLVLPACGGGSSSSGGSVTPPAAPAAPSIILGAQTVNFFARVNETSPDAGTLNVSWTHGTIVDVDAQVSGGAVLPDWLTISKSGTVSPISFEFQVTRTDMVPMDYAVTLDIIARDSANAALVTETVTVNYELGPFGAENRANMDTIFHFGQPVILNGANVAWSADSVDWYNRDIGTADEFGLPRTNIDSFRAHFASVARLGGNSARIWLHTASTVTPAIDASGTVTGLSRDLTDAQVVEQVEGILDAAWEKGILVTFNLFSFNMVCDINQPVRAKAMLENNFQSYIDEALTPLVSGVKDHPALFAWDVFNEPEGMEMANLFCPSTETVTLETVQQVVNRTAAAIHKLDPNVKVTTSTHTEYFDRFSNSTLAMIPGFIQNGTIDFYSLHWYVGWMVSPFDTMVGDFNGDRPIIVGEYSPDDAGAAPAPTESIRTLIGNGYKGAWPWSLTTGDEAQIVNTIGDAASVAGLVDKAAVEACIQDKPANCYVK